MIGAVAIQFRLNGVERRVDVPANRLLVDVLRDDLGQTGTKLGCGTGVCGTCSVIVNDALMSSCLVLAVTIDGADIRTVEGLAGTDMKLDTLQRAFIEHGGFQCGICTSGQLMAATALLEAHPAPSHAEIRRWMMGNLCRCTGYLGIVRAIEAASRTRG